uniref:Uncharacterized protein n=1 Tax=Lepeophtheirus salmonis TaxID=72036 RepID=A0A0K2TZ49_LEPSM
MTTKKTVGNAESLRAQPYFFAPRWYHMRACFLPILLAIVNFGVQVRGIRSFQNKRQLKLDMDYIRGVFTTKLG